MSDNKRTRYLSIRDSLPEVLDVCLKQLPHTRFPLPLLQSQLPERVQVNCPLQSPFQERVLVPYQNTIGLK